MLKTQFSFTRILFASILLLTFFLYLSCSPQISIEVKENFESDIVFSSSLENSIEAQVRKLIGLDTSTTLFQKDAIEKSFEIAEISIDEVILPAPNALYIHAKKQNLQKENNTITKFVQVKTIDKKTVFTIDLSPKILQTFMQTMPQENQDYVNLLMAPALTNENMDSQEYLGLFSLIYGQQISKAFENSTLFITIRAPKKINKAQVSNKDIAKLEIKNNTAYISLCLYKLLALNETAEKTENKKLLIELEWDK